MNSRGRWTQRAIDKRALQCDRTNIGLCVEKSHNYRMPLRFYRRSTAPTLLAKQEGQFESSQGCGL